MLKLELAALPTQGCHVGHGEANTAKYRQSPAPGPFHRQDGKKQNIRLLRLRQKIIYWKVKLKLKLPRFYWSSLIIIIFFSVIMAKALAANHFEDPYQNLIGKQLNNALQEAELKLRPTVRKKSKVSIYFCIYFNRTNRSKTIRRNWRKLVHFCTKVDRIYGNWSKPTKLCKMKFKDFQKNALKSLTKNKRPNRNSMKFLQNFVNYKQKVKCL